MLAVVTNKTHTGHLEGGAAMTTLIAAVLQVKKSAVTPIGHFKQLNPHLEQASFDAYFNSELSTYKYGQGISHVSSFGFGGTNGHVIFWGQSQLGVSQDVKTRVMQRLKKMAVPEVRVQGNSPDEWEYDGPDAEIKPGDRYTLRFNPDEASIKFVKEEVADTPEDEGEEDFYSISGDFNDWAQDHMEDGLVPGSRTVIVEVPPSGSFQFRLTKNDDSSQCFAPEYDRCTKMTSPIVGPQSDLSNVWLVNAEPGSQIKIDFFIFKRHKGIMWMPVPVDE